MHLADPTQHEIYFGQHHFEDLNPLSCGYHDCPAGHIAKGMRPFYMIHFVEDGCGTLYFDGREQKVNKGQIFIIRPYEDIRYVADSETPWRYVYICFDGAQAKKLDTLGVRVTELSAAPFATLRALEERKDTREEMALSALYMIFAELLSGKAKHPHYVRRTVNMIHASYHSEQLSVSRIAEELSLDRRYLVRLFKEKTGGGIQEYIIKVRMDNAKALLENGFSVSATAAMVGYRDSFNFSKMFKKFVGSSPKQYAQAHRSSDKTS
ncbi:MAG: helix-turn-helix domain-containing protein [Clostridia bacterium]|nr:helix-turn-helix domain-containing protein [Clostridia bacterium]